MSSLDGQSLFSSGPHDFRCDGWKREIVAKAFPGLSGALLIDHGRRGRAIHQTGRLQSPDRETVLALIAAIESFEGGSPHTLVDNHGRAFGNVLMEHFEQITPIRKGRGYWCDYAIRYRQLP